MRQLYYQCAPQRLNTTRLSLKGTFISFQWDTLPPVTETTKHLSKKIAPRDPDVYAAFLVHTYHTWFGRSFLDLAAGVLFLEKPLPDYLSWEVYTRSFEVLDTIIELSYSNCWGGLQRERVRTLGNEEDLNKGNSSDSSEDSKAEGGTTGDAEQLHPSRQPSRLLRHLPKHRQPLSRRE